MNYYTPKDLGQMHKIKQSAKFPRQGRNVHPRVVSQFPREGSPFISGTKFVHTHQVSVTL